MGRQTVDQSQAVLPFQPRKTDSSGSSPTPAQSNRHAGAGRLREKLAPFYSDIGRPSIDPELMIGMLIVGYCYGIRIERKLCEEVSGWYPAAGTCQQRTAMTARLLPKN